MAIELTKMVQRRGKLTDSDSFLNESLNSEDLEEMVGAPCVDQSKAGAPNASDEQEQESELRESNVLDHPNEEEAKNTSQNSQKIDLSDCEDDEDL